MKKNFLMVAALLIAAMLMVVSCTQEVAPKNDGLVEAKLGLAYGKDVTVGTANNEVITYTYQLTPMWSGVDNSTEIYGNQKETVVNNDKKYTVSTPVSNVDMGLVTPGLWKITVRGYTGFSSLTDKGEQVLFGENNAYFVKESGKATVIVSPTTSTGVGTVDISLEMQDLGEGKNVINYSIYNVTEGKYYTETAEETVNETVENTPRTYSLDRSQNAVDNVYTYTKTLRNVKAGYNTITFSTKESAGNGGIVKTFLVIPGNTVTIRGSVSPSEFQTAKAEIVTVSMSGATLSITDQTPAESGMYSLNKGTNYTVNVNTNDILTTLASNLPEGATAGTTEYKWYVNGGEIEGQTGTSYVFNQSDAGDYTVTCTFKYSFLKDQKTYTWIGDASLGKIRVTVPTSPSVQEPSTH